MISSAHLAQAVALTTTLTASTNTHLTLGLYNHTIRIEWTPGTTNNVLTFAIDTRITGGEWVQQMEWDESATAGTYTKTNRLNSHTATGTTVTGLTVLLDEHCNELRVRYAESEAGSSTKGTITVHAYSSD